MPKGLREEKFAALAKLSLHGPDWSDCPSGWRDPFLPTAAGAWAVFPKLKDFFVYDGSGVMPGRTWIIAPDTESLAARWSRLIAERNSEKKELFFHAHLRKGKPGDKHVRKKITEGLSGHEERFGAVIDDHQPSIAATRYGFRFLDRQWIIPDARLITSQILLFGSGILIGKCI